MSLKGSLSSINLADIMQLVANSRQTGRFVLASRSGHVGEIYFADGDILHAAVDGYMGEDAVFTLISWAEGDFEFQEGSFQAERTVHTSVTSLLMESARRIDEWKLLRKKIGSVDSVPEFNEINRAERRKISLSTLEWVVISKIDGNKSVEQVSRESGVNIYDTARMIYGMIASGLLRLKN